MNETTQRREAIREVGVVLRRSDIDNPWIDHVWSPEAILAEVPETKAWTQLSQSEGSTLWYAGAGALELYPSETGNYRDNLVLEPPQIWVALRRRPEDNHIEVMQVTVDPTEGESLHEAGAESVSAVPMPDDVVAWVADFIERFHVERVFHKRERDKSSPDRRKNPGMRRNGDLP